MKQKTTDLESIIKSLRDTIDYQKRLDDENETNKQELKRKQDDFEQFQQVLRSIFFRSERRLFLCLDA